MADKLSERINEASEVVIITRDGVEEEYLTDIEIAVIVAALRIVEKPENRAK